MKGWIAFIVVVALCLAILIYVKRGGEKAAPPPGVTATPAHVAKAAPGPASAGTPIPQTILRASDMSFTPGRGETVYYVEETLYNSWGAGAQLPAYLQVPIKTEPVDQTVGDVRLRGYLAAPSATKPLGSIMLIHEWWGLSVTIRKETESWARQGYVAFAVDLYKGTWTSDRAGAAKLMTSVDPAETLATLKAGLGFLGGATKGEPLKTAVIGYGFGAQYALKFALENHQPAALILYYGEPTADPKPLAQLTCPALGVYAKLDGLVTPQKVAEFDKALTEAKVPHELVSYDAYPGFALNPQTQFEEVHAQESHQKALEFLQQHLAP